MKIKSKIMICLLMITVLAQAAQEKKGPQTIRVGGERTILNLMPEARKIARDVWRFEILPYLNSYDLPKKVWAKSFNKSVIAHGMLPQKKNVASQEEIDQLDFKRFKRDDVVFALYSPDHAHVYTIYGTRNGLVGYQAYIWNMKTKKQEHVEYGSSIEGLKEAEFSKDSKGFMIMDKDESGLIMYDITISSINRYSSSYPNKKIILHPSKIVQAHFVWNDQTFITLSQDGRIRIWDIKSDEPLNELLPAVDWHDPFVVSEDGSQIIVQESENRQRVWQSSFGKLTLEQWIFIWIIDEYYTKLAKLNPKHRNKVLKLIAHIKHIDINELLRVYHTFSPENKKILREVYDLDVPDIDLEPMQGCCIIS
ncbi:MAG: hypothetical protein P4L31_07985 [Candidatus Babeliales bacterium]|nr:hypothetical protein [Candidatus Babeliales bacterium]